MKLINKGLAFKSIIAAIYFSGFCYFIFLGYDLLHSTDANLRVENEWRSYEKQLTHQDGLVIDPRFNLILSELARRFFSTLPIYHTNEYRYSFKQPSFFHQKQIFDQQVKQFKLEQALLTLTKWLDQSLSHRSIHDCIGLKASLQALYPNAVEQSQAFYRLYLYQALSQKYSSMIKAQEQIKPMHQSTDQAQQTDQSIQKLLDQNLVFYPKSIQFNRQIEQMSCEHPLIKALQSGKENQPSLLLLYFYAPWLSINRYLLESIVFIPFLGTKMIYGTDLIELKEPTILWEILPFLQSLKTRRW
jgi:hypothetical protein